MATFTILIEQDEDGWFVSEVVELPGCHTQAKTLDELSARTKEAISLCLECEKPMENGRFFGLQKIEV